MSGFGFVLEIAGAIKRGIRLAEKLDDAGEDNPILGQLMDIYGAALDGCVNEGQVSIIESVGWEGFKEATMASAEGEDAGSVLLDMCSHPDAVGDILEEAGMGIDDMLDQFFDDYNAERGGGE
jgi:hypothetical protein